MPGAVTSSSQAEDYLVDKTKPALVPLACMWTEGRLEQHS